MNKKNAKIKKKTQKISPKKNSKISTTKKNSKISTTKKIQKFQDNKNSKFQKIKNFKKKLLFQMKYMYKNGLFRTYFLKQSMAKKVFRYFW